MVVALTQSEEVAGSIPASPTIKALNVKTIYFINHARVISEINSLLGDKIDLEVLNKMFPSEFERST